MVSELSEFQMGNTEASWEFPQDPAFVVVPLYPCGAH